MTVEMLGGASQMATKDSHEMSALVLVVVEITHLQRHCSRECARALPRMIHRGRHHANCMVPRVSKILSIPRRRGRAKGRERAYV